MSLYKLKSGREDEDIRTYHVCIHELWKMKLTGNRTELIKLMCDNIIMITLSTSKSLFSMILSILRYCM
jgi:hypothetical protein